MDESESERLVAYIRSLSDFTICSEIDANYNHIGATLADAVLQSNANYESTVRKRVTCIRTKHGTATSRSALERLMQEIGAQKILNWKGTRKPKTFRELVELLRREDIDTEADLRRWLTQDDTGPKLRAIRFVGPKTVDYLKILVGLGNAAIDRHLLGFLERAGLGRPSYQRAQAIIHQAADLMGVDRAFLDHSIWRYMSRRQQGDCETGGAVPCVRTAADCAVVRRTPPRPG